MPAVVSANGRTVFAFGIYAGRIEHDGSGWHLAYDASWNPLGCWSTEAMAARAIETDLLRRLYRPQRTKCRWPPIRRR